MIKARAIVKNKDVQLQLVLGWPFSISRERLFFEKNEFFRIEIKTWHSNCYSISISEKTKRGYQEN